MSAYTIALSSSFAEACPSFCGAAVCATVTNADTSPQLQDEIDETLHSLCLRYTPQTIKQRSGIAATRAAYHATGKDPSRYRPACEQLARRVLQGKSLYRVDTLVDIGNLVSLISGYSTGAIDADKLIGHHIELGIGQDDEPYEGIGRGALNIKGLPVYRDAAGAFATPTSDSIRTMLSPGTCHLILLINAYDGDMTGLQTAIELTRDLLLRYARGTDFNVIYYPRGF